MIKTIFITLIILLLSNSTAFAEISWKKVEDNAIWGLKLGDKYPNNLGKPIKIKKENNLVTYCYKGLNISVNPDNFIRSFIIKSPKYITHRGIKIGDIKQKVLKLYNEPTFKIQSNGNQILVYQSDEKVGQVYYINFYILNNRVIKIYIHSELIW